MFIKFGIVGWSRTDVMPLTAIMMSEFVVLLRLCHFSGKHVLNILFLMRNGGTWTQRTQMGAYGYRCVRMHMDAY